MSQTLTIIVCPFCDVSMARTSRAEVNQLWYEHLTTDHAEGY